MMNGMKEDSPLLLVETTFSNAHNADDDVDRRVGRGGRGGGGRATVTETIINLTKTCMGTGCLGLPFACRQAGMLLFCVGTIAIAAWNVYSVLKLCQCLQYLSIDDQNGDNLIPNNDNEDPNYNITSTIITDSTHSDADQEHCESLQTWRLTNAPPPPAGTSTFGVVTWYAFGRQGLFAVDLMFLLFYLGVIVSYLVAVMSFVGDTMLNQGPFLNSLVAGLVMSLLSLVPDIGYLSKVSGTGIAVLVASFVAIAVYGLVHPTSHYGSEVNNTESATLATLPSSLSGVSQWFGVVVFGYGYVPLTYNFRESMRQPERLVPAASMAMVVVTSLYLIMSIGIYALFPSVQGEIMHELPPTGIVPTLLRLSMAAVVLTTGPILIVCCGQMMEAKFGITQHHLVVRFAIVAICIVIAILVPYFVQVLAFVGCTFLGILGFCFPPLLHLRVSKMTIQAHWISQIEDWALLIWGMGVTMVCSIYIFRQSS